METKQNLKCVEPEPIFGKFFQSCHVKLPANDSVLTNALVKTEVFLPGKTYMDISWVIYTVVPCHHKKKQKNSEEEEQTLQSKDFIQK
jgi:hypothetical protein